MSREKERTVTLHIYTDLYQAKMMQDKLKENGIDSFLNDENVLGMDPVGGVELRVFEKDKESAEKILHA
ncbi:MAG: DUF2007 domain-containing protein [Chitinophagales bacterium]|nr:DUF2007 domain-containing protein [Chitinophagales bacterium]